MPPEVIYDPARIDFSQLVADEEGIQSLLPQRYEMAQLTAIVLFDPEQSLIIGYKDVRPDEFWVRGHFPEWPLMPGVLQCEAAAQLCSYYIMNLPIMAGEIVGFGGMENVRFRSPVRPGDRLVLVARCNRIKSRQALFTVQGFVGSTMVFQGDVIGVPLTRPAPATTVGQEV